MSQPSAPNDIDNPLVASKDGAGQSTGQPVERADHSGRAGVNAAEVKNGPRPVASGSAATDVAGSSGSTTEAALVPSPASQHRTYNRLQLVAHELKKAADQALSETGLTTAQTAVLVVVSLQEAVSQRSVANQLGYNESAVTAMVRKLTSANLLVRTQDPNDARLRLLSLTEEGRRALNSARRPFATINQAIDEALSAEEVALLSNFLDRLSETLQD